MKRIGAIVLAVLLLLPTFAAVQPLQAQAAAPIRVLAIGHSYSNNATELIGDIIESMGLEGKLEVYSLYYAGCSLNQHVSFYENNQAVYELRLNGRNVKGTGGMMTMQEAFAYKAYDYVTLQQEPGQAAVYSSFEPALGQLAAIVRREEPRAKLQIHQTWAFCKSCASGGHAYGVFDYPSSDAMFAEIEKAYATAADKLGETGIIPCGEAIQLAKKRGYYDGHNPNAHDDVMQCANNALYADNIDHLNQRGKYLTACVWIEHYLGADTREATFVSSVLDEDDCAKLRQIAHEVVTGDTSAYKPKTTAGKQTTTTKQSVTSGATTTTANTPVEDDASGQPDNTMLIILIAAIGGGVLLLGGIVVTIVVLLKKK